MEPRQFDIQEREDRRGTVFEGLAAGPSGEDPGLKVFIRVSQESVILYIRVGRGQVDGLAGRLAEILGPPSSSPDNCLCLFDSSSQTTIWEFPARKRPEILQKVRTFLGLAPEAATG